MNYAMVFVNDIVGSDYVDGEVYKGPEGVELCFCEFTKNSLTGCREKRVKGKLRRAW